MPFLQQHITVVHYIYPSCRKWYGQYSTILTQQIKKELDIIIVIFNRMKVKCSFFAADTIKEFRKIYQKTLE